MGKISMKWGLGALVVIGGLILLGLRPDLRERLYLRWSGYRVQVSDIAPDVVGFVTNSCRHEPCFCVAAIPDLPAEKAEGRSTVGGWKRLNELLETTPGKAVIIQLLDHGSGGSSTPRHLAAEVRDLLERLPEPQCSKWIVVGQGYGGWVAQWLGLDWASEVHRLVLLSPQGEIGGDQLGSLVPPTLVVWGKEDRVQPLMSSYRIRSALPLRTLWRELGGCGHDVQEKCFDQIRQAVVDMAKFGAM